MGRTSASPARNPRWRIGLTRVAITPVTEERHGFAGALRPRGAWGPSRGPHVHQPAMSGPPCRSSPPITHARVDREVREVDDEVADDVHEREDEDGSHHDGKIALADSRDQESAEPGPCEHGF